MHTVEMMVMSGVIRSADFKPPRPALSIGVGQKPRDPRGWSEPAVSETGHYLVERIAQVFSAQALKGIWTLHR
jgi:hypothetical protein